MIASVSQGPNETDFQNNDGDNTERHQQWMPGKERPRLSLLHDEIAQLSDVASDAGGNRCVFSNASNHRTNHRWRPVAKVFELLNLFHTLFVDRAHGNLANRIA
jgi:hypothetical protein